jgi:MFS family permease
MQIAPRIFTLNFFRSCLLIIPVFIPLIKSLGFNLTDAYILQGVFAFALIIFQFPSGYLADRYGRGKILLLASMINLLANSILIFNQSWSSFVVFQFLLGMGASFFSGTDTAILIEEQKNRLEYNEVLAKRLNSLQFGEVSAAIITSGLFLLFQNFSFQNLIMINGILSLIPFIIVLSFQNRTWKKLHIISSKKDYWDGIKTLNLYIKFCLAVFVFYEGMTYVLMWSLQEYWSQKDFDLKTIGGLWGYFSLLVIISIKLLKKFSGKWKFQRLLFFQLVSLCLFLLMSLYFKPQWTMVSLVFLAFIKSTAHTYLKDKINLECDNKIRSTVNSLGSLGVGLFVILFGPFVGLLIDHLNLEYVYFWILIISIILGLSFVFFEHRFKDIAPVSPQ